MLTSTMPVESLKKAHKISERKFHSSCKYLMILGVTWSPSQKRKIKYNMQFKKSATVSVNKKFSEFTKKLNMNKD